MFITPKQKKELLRFSLVTAAILSVWAIYMGFVGVPSTIGRNLYNQAMATTNKELRKELLTESLNTWYADYVKQELDKE